MVDLVNDDDDVEQDDIATMAPLGPVEPRLRTKGLLIAADSDKNNNRLFEDDRYFNQEEVTGGVVHENLETQPEQAPG